jgi:hypothetical protein
MNRLFWGENGNKNTYRSIEQIKKTLIEESHWQVRNILSDTDWFIIRLLDATSNRLIPIDIQTKRLEGRVVHRKQLELIDAATNISELEALFDNNAFKLKKPELTEDDFKNYRERVKNINKEIESSCHVACE